jgi:Ca-activated chloride channel family protein
LAPVLLSGSFRSEPFERGEWWIYGRPTEVSRLDAGRRELLRVSGPSSHASPAWDERNIRMTESSLSAPREQSDLKLQHVRKPFSAEVPSREFASSLSHLATFLVLIAVPSLTWVQESVHGQPGDAYTIKVNVDMVVLGATAQDRKKTPVSGLGKDDFQVYEDGVLQTIKYFSHEDIPVTVGLVIDNSGSMRPKRRDVIGAALAFARSSNPHDQMFVVNFNERVSFGLPVNTPFTDQVAQLEKALSRVRADGETALYDAVAAALEHLKSGSRDRKVLIVISDGGDNASKHRRAEIMALVGQNDAMIYTIGIFDHQDADRNPGVLKQLAKNSGGEAFLPESLKDIAPICERIAHDIRNQYTIAYIPTNGKRDGKYRAIQVKASTPGGGHLSVRTRTGYFAPAALPSSAAKATAHENQN